MSGYGVVRNIFVGLLYRASDSRSRHAKAMTQTHELGDEWSKHYQEYRIQTNPDGEICCQAYQGADRLYVDQTPEALVESFLELKRLGGRGGSLRATTPSFASKPVMTMRRTKLGRARFQEVGTPRKAVTASLYNPMTLSKAVSFRG